MKCKVQGDFHFFAYDCSRDLAPFVEKDYPSTFGLPLLVITQLSICLWVYSWVLYSVLLIYVTVFISAPYQFDDYSFVVLSEVREHGNSSFVLFFQDCSSDRLCFRTNFRTICHEYFDRDFIKYIDCFEQHGHFSNINSSNP